MAKTASLERQDREADCLTNASHGKFYWNELMTRDVERAKRFYGDTIG